jgi:enamine deaminase RidA (YjgF/YER057c/UK114 family)
MCNNICRKGVKMTSEQLQQAQRTLETLCKREVDQPMTDYSKLNRWLKTVKEIDLMRRELWNEEKFGECESLVDKIYSDDIPF